MKYLTQYLSTVQKQIHACPGCVLIMDFDGTLTEIAPSPEQALLEKDVQLIIKKISRIIPTAILTGRNLEDIKQKVGIKDLIYAGDHGLEWEIK